MEQAKVVSKTVKYGGNHYQSTAHGDIQVLMFGWHPTGKNPRWSWEYIDSDKVPSDVKRLLR